MTIILRGLTITIAEIEIHESPARPAGERPEPRGNEPAPAPLAASTLPGDGETPGAAEEARPSVTGPGTSAANPSTVLAEPTVAEMLAQRAVGPADIGATLAVVGDRVREAVANPPLPVERPIELALTRAEGSWPAMPDFLTRRSKSCGDGDGPVSVDTQPRAPGHGGRAAPSADAGEGAGRCPGPHDTNPALPKFSAPAAVGAAVVPTGNEGRSGERDTASNLTVPTFLDRRQKREAAP